MGVVRIEIPVDENAAEALGDPRRRAAVGRLVSRLLHPAADDDPLVALLEATSRDAAAAGLNEADIAAELAAWKVERAARRT
jgi:hypothetical protein